MVSLITSSAVDRGFEHRSGQTKDYKIGICCFSLGENKLIFNGMMMRSALYYTDRLSWICIVLAH
jgi:hypothetical protein